VPIKRAVAKLPTRANPPRKGFLAPEWSPIAPKIGAVNPIINIAIVLEYPQ